MEGTDGDDPPSGIRTRRRRQNGAATSPDPDRTADEAREELSELLDDRGLVVVSNREPYSHEYEDGEIVVEPPVGGLTAALDPIMQELSETWVAWGSGGADREVADESGCVALPPDEESYDLRRVWLTDDEVEGYYRGYSNRVLWPICHGQTSKTDVRPADWQTYRDVNETFADAVIDRCSDDAVVWFQDYHFALAPRYVRQARPDALLAHFWHIPWPAWDVFQTCPQRDAVLRGLLANDLLGFHTEAHCRNFLDCVEAGGIGRVDRPTASVLLDGHRTHVRSFPIGIDADRWAGLARTSESEEFWRSFREEYGLADRSVAVGVERLDYTKGIERRFDALEYLWAEHPELRGRLTYVQKGSPSRGEIPEYGRLQDRIEDRVEALNGRFGTDDWQPVIYLRDQLPGEALAALYREAELALVTPVRDGMNLVAKEFVAAQVAEPGVLVLSELAGASEQLGPDAVLVNPYDPAGVAEAIAGSLEMPADERRRRLSSLRNEVRTSDVYTWLVAQFRSMKRILARRRYPDEIPT